jgi:heat-inducible transcriptional repressor
MDPNNIKNSLLETSRYIGNTPILVYHPILLRKKSPHGSLGNTLKNLENEKRFSSDIPIPQIGVILSEREELILNAVITSYILKKKPIGSRVLAQTFPFQLSAASIRNVLADLESKGFLFSNHRSSGRIPTVHAYRYYVENLIQMEDINLEEKKIIQEEYLKHELKLDKILQVTSKILSLLSKNASIVLGPGEDLSILKHIELISVTPLEILIIMVTRTGTVFNKTIFTENPVAQDELYKISRFLNKNLKGYDVKDIRDELIPRIKKMQTDIKSLPMIVNKFHEHLNSSVSEPVMYLEGYEKFNSMFTNSEKESLNSLFEVFDEKTVLREVFTNSISTDGLNTIILDKDNKRMPGLSLITTHFRMGEKKVGAMGVMGPNRMCYYKILPLVSFMSKIVSEMITKLSK